MRRLLNEEDGVALFNILLYYRNFEKIDGV